jgi:hypothetical protein
MLTLGNLFALLLLATLFAWLWRGFGIREQALKLVKQHCQRANIELLDGNVAFLRLRTVRDERGRRRLARLYAFEFTVTGEQRHSGRIVMFGMLLGRIEMDPYPFEPAVDAPQTAPTQPCAPVIELQQWRRDHPASGN